MRHHQNTAYIEDHLRAANEDVVKGNVDKLDDVADGAHDYLRR